MVTCIERRVVEITDKNSIFLPTIFEVVKVPSINIFREVLNINIYRSLD